MFRTKKYVLLITLIILIITACGSNAENESAIQTAVAETVVAQNISQPSVTETLAATLIPTQTPYQLPTSLPTLPPTTSASGSNQKIECASASLQDESIVDGTIFAPGEQFTKTWYVTNTSTCVWDTNYKIIFWDGNVLGGGYVYNLPQVTGPGQTIPISLVLTAPAVDGMYRSEWKLQTPDGINFGVGYLNASFYTEIEVTSDTTPDYAVTSIDLYITREPAFGCEPANVVYTAYATFTTNGPVEVVYRWAQQDGNDGGKQFFKMTEAGTKTVTRVWKLGRAASQNDNRWFQIILVLDEVEKAYPPVGFTHECP